MPNYNDDFYYDYKPKGEVDDADVSTDDIFSSNTGRDISSYTKGTAATKKAPARTVPAKRPAAKKPAPAKNSPAPVKAKKAVEAVIDTYGNFCFKSLGNIIKVISFVVAFAIIILSLVLAFTLFKARTGLSLISLLTIIGGTVFAAIIFFPLYGIGHIICQNNEILRIFNDK